MTLKELEIGKSAVIKTVGGEEVPLGSIFWIWA